VEDRKLGQGRLQGMVGSKKALVEKLFAEHGGALRAFFYRRVRRQPEAADLAQEVYLRLLRVPDMDSIRNPEAYLYTVASNLAKEHALKERHLNAALDIDEPAVQEQLADLPGFGTFLDNEARVSGRRRTAVHAGTELCGDRPATRHFSPHGQEILEPRAGSLPTAHGAAGMSL